LRYFQLVEHDPEKWTPVFRKIMLKTKSRARDGKAIARENARIQDIADGNRDRSFPPT
jgi:hypothetical protein